MKPSSSAAPYFTALDSLRGLCAIMVVLFHFRANSHIDNLAVIQNSWLFVDFFFVLSGFVIAANYGQKLRNGGVSIGRFMGLRLARLYPLHLFVLGVFVATEALKTLLQPRLSALSLMPFTNGRSLSLLPENIALLQSLGPNFGLSGVFSWNVPAWSISAEVWTYLLFALALFAGSFGIRVFRFVALIGLPLAIVVYNAGDLAMQVNGGIYRCIIGFGVGSVLWALFQSHCGPNRWLGHLEVPVFIGMFAFVSLASSYGLTILAPLVFALVLWIFAVEAGPLSSILKTRGFLLLGTLSYSIYMVHTFIRARIENLAMLAEQKVGWKIFSDLPGETVGTSTLAGDALVGVGIILTICISFLTWKFIEMPGQKLVRGWVLGKHGKSLDGSANAK